MSSKQTYFKNEWLQKLEYKGWLEAGADNTTAYCKKCRKHFKLSNMGEAAIKSHLYVISNPDLVQNHKLRTTLKLRSQKPLIIMMHHFILRVMM